MTVAHWWESDYGSLESSAFTPSALKPNLRLWLEARFCCMLKKYIEKISVLLSGHWLSNQTRKGTKT